jgi:thiol:disulfide interchange protein DsbD
VSEITMTSQLFSYPAFSIGVGVIIAVMAVGMCGLFAVRLPQFVYRLNPGHDTMVGSFGFGVMTAVLSTPCTAPLMGGASAWAITQPPGMTLSVFAAIGIGMAAPYLVLSAFPQWAQRMPRTGPASELIKQVMGLLMLAAAAYFIGIGVCILLKPADTFASLLYWWPVMGLCAVAGGWLIYRTAVIAGRGGMKHIFITVGLLMIVSSLYAGARLTEPSEINWLYYTPQKFEQARVQKKVIVLEFTAEWCLNCKALEETVLSHRAVIDALNQDQVAAIKVDLTDENDKASRLKLAETGMLAPPVLVIYARDGSELLKANSYTSGQIVKAVERGLLSVTDPVQ